MSYSSIRRDILQLRDVKLREVEELEEQARALQVLHAIRPSLPMYFAWTSSKGIVEMDLPERASTDLKSWERDMLHLRAILKHPQVTDEVAYLARLGLVVRFSLSGRKFSLHVYVPTAVREALRKLDETGILETLKGKR